MSMRGVMRRSCALVGLGLGIAACGRSSGHDVVDATPASSATVLAVASAAPEPAKPAPCDGRELWFGGGDMTYEEREASFKKVAKAWTRECRHEALLAECGRGGGCRDTISGPLIDSAADDAERRALLGERVAANEAALVTAKDFLKRAAEITAYARSLRGDAPRGLNGVCMGRMRVDFSRIEKLRAEIRQSGHPLGVEVLQGALGSAKLCLDCSDNRNPCNDMKEELDIVKENIRDAEKALAADRKALGKR